MHSSRFGALLGTKTFIGVGSKENERRRRKGR
jgi:hypothetical protein